MIALGVLISGSGSNLQAIIDAIAENELDASVTAVISDKEDAYGLVRAREAGIPAYFIDPKKYTDNVAFNREIRDIFIDAGADYLVMAGYMKLLGTSVLDAFPNHVLNLHPALLPSFKGAHAIEDALGYGVKVTGVTVHFANEDFDCGAIIAQVPVEIEEGDTLESLAMRIHETEHVLYPRVLRQLAREQIHSIDNIVHIFHT